MLDRTLTAMVTLVLPDGRVATVDAVVDGESSALASTSTSALRVVVRAVFSTSVTCSFSRLPPASVAWAEKDDAMENGWFSQKRHESVGK